MTIAACLIVKNEAQVIERCLESLVWRVDAAVVVDTGSTDNTWELLNTLSYPFPIHQHRRPWVNFAHNRNESLALAMPVADYVLLMDADQTADGTLPKLTADCYNIKLVNGQIEWPKPLLLRSGLPWKFEGVTHEYLVCDAKHTSAQCPSLVITEHGDGGGRAPGTHHLWEWDAKALEEDLERDPTNTRSVFYLARSYDDLACTRPDDAMAGEWLRLAIARYQQRSVMGGWPDESFYSLYRLGCLTNELPYLFQAWNMQPHRWEPVQVACRLLNERNMHRPSYALSKHALSGNPTAPNGLFVLTNVYDHLMLFEHSIAAYWVGEYRESLEACQALLAKKLPSYLEVAVRRNIEFPKQKLGL